MRWRSEARNSSIWDKNARLALSAGEVSITSAMPPLRITTRRSPSSARIGSWVDISTILSWPTSRSRARRRSMPAFSISSIKITGDAEISAVSAIISARDCPPDSWVSATPGSNGSPARSLAHAITSSAMASGCSAPRLRACKTMNSRAGRSMTKFMFWVSWATNRCPSRKR